MMPPDNVRFSTGKSSYGDERSVTCVASKTEGRTDSSKTSHRVSAERLMTANTHCGLVESAV